MPKKNIEVILPILPPLRQSTEVPMSCEVFYTESMIKGNRMPGGMESARGKQVHSVVASYASWCASKQVSMDLQAFDHFAKGAGPQATKILVGLRDGYQVDWAHLLATELTMRLDAFFKPTKIDEAVAGLVEDNEAPAVYEGTLDALYIFQDQQRIEVHDAKTHVRPYDPSEPDKSLQGKMYSLFCFLHFPWAQKVKFRLFFVRYRNLVREVEYSRSDIPALIEALKFRRAAQEKLHEKFNSGAPMEETAGDHCTYCPLLASASCRIAKYNPNMNLTYEQRLNFALFYSQFSKVNNAAMKAHVDATGKPVVLRDYNGKAYTYGAVEIEAESYPLFKVEDDGIARDTRGRLMMPIVELLEDYIYSTPEDTEWMGKIVLSSSSMKSYLKANKRAFLHQSIQDNSNKFSKVRFQVSKPLDAPPVDEDDEFEEEEELA